MQVFEGVRVVELAEGVAVPYAGKLFGDFGADVIKVELPEGDVSRGWGPFIEGIAGSERSAPFSFFNRNKRGVSLDLATTWGRKAALALAMSAELVLTDRSFRQLDELGLGFDALADHRPGVSVVSLTPFGEDGPYANYQATDLVLDAIAGPMNLSGSPGTPPLSKPFNMVAAQVGNTMATAAMVALYSGRRTGEAERVEVSAADVLLTSFDRRAIALIVSQFTGEDMQRPFRYDPPVPLPRGPRPCKDGYVEVASSLRWLPRILASIDDDELNTYFAETPDAASRPETAERAEAAVMRWLSSRTRADAFRESTLENRWPVYPVNEPADVLVDEHFVNRGLFVDVDHPVSGPQRQIGAPWRMADGGFRVRRPAPTFGQHNDEILIGELGLDASSAGEPRSREAS